MKKRALPVFISLLVTVCAVLLYMQGRLAPTPPAAAPPLATASTPFTMTPPDNGAPPDLPAGILFHRATLHDPDYAREHPASIKAPPPMAMTLPIPDTPSLPPDKSGMDKVLNARYYNLKWCYGKVEPTHPEMAGKMGVDLLVSTSTSDPTRSFVENVEMVASDVKNSEFEECIFQVFADMPFDPPPGGSTKMGFEMRFTSK